MPVPETWEGPQVREVMSVRLDPELKAALDGFVAELRAEGWPLQKHHVVEYLLRELKTEEGRAKVRAELGARGPGKR